MDMTTVVFLSMGAVVLCGLVGVLGFVYLWQKENQRRKPCYKGSALVTVAAGQCGVASRRVDSLLDD
jgi:hypothetical protein